MNRNTDLRTGPLIRGDLNGPGMLWSALLTGNMATEGLQSGTHSRDGVANNNTARALWDKTIYRTD